MLWRDRPRPGLIKTPPSRVTPPGAGPGLSVLICKRGGAGGLESSTGYPNATLCADTGLMTFPRDSNKMRKKGNDTGASPQSQPDSVLRPCPSLIWGSDRPFLSMLCWPSGGGLLGLCLLPVLTSSLGTEKVAQLCARVRRGRLSPEASPSLSLTSSAQAQSSEAGVSGRERDPSVSRGCPAGSRPPTPCSPV